MVGFPTENAADFGEELNKKFRDDLGRKFRVLCLSRNRTSVLMWGHYTRSHAGVVLGFDTTVAGFPNEYDDSAQWSTNLFQPAIDVTKTGDPLSKIGDTVNYTITVFNNSSADTPAMEFDIVDALLGINQQNVVIANGGNHVIQVNDWHHRSCAQLYGPP